MLVELLIIMIIVLCLFYFQPYPSYTNLQFIGWVHGNKRTMLLYFHQREKLFLAKDEDKFLSLIENNINNGCRVLIDNEEYVVQIDK